MKILINSLTISRQNSSSGPLLRFQTTLRSPVAFGCPNTWRTATHIGGGHDERADEHCMGEREGLVAWSDESADDDDASDEGTWSDYDGDESVYQVSAIESGSVSTLAECDDLLDDGCDLTWLLMLMLISIKSAPRLRVRLYSRVTCLLETPSKSDVGM